LTLRADLDLIEVSADRSEFREDGLLGHLFDPFAASRLFANEIVDTRGLPGALPTQAGAPRTRCNVAL
jgi:hypothetical protein